ncbi:MAG: AAA family ATPase [Thermofilum sp.]|jgi:DNA repair protein RadA|nr:AAA family ATPase [Thermofilum sp.]
MLSLGNLLGVLGFSEITPGIVPSLAMSSATRFSTGVRSLDDLLEGGVEVGSITELIGEFGAGKTQICHQLAVMVQLPKERGGLNARALYIDTEGTFRPERIIQIARAKQLDPEKTLENIIYARAYSVEDVFRVLERAKLEAVKRDVGLIVLDEATRLFRAEFLRTGERILAYSRLLSFLEEFSRSSISVVFTRQVVYSDGIIPASAVVFDGFAHLSLFLSKKGDVWQSRALSSPWSRRTAYYRISEEGVVDV